MHGERIAGMEEPKLIGMNPMQLRAFTASEQVIYGGRIVSAALETGVTRKGIGSDASVGFAEVPAFRMGRKLEALYPVLSFLHAVFP